MRVQAAHHPEVLGRPSLKGAPATSPLNVPMIILNLIDELRRSSGDIAEAEVGDGSSSSLLTRSGIDFVSEEQWCIAEIMKHVIPERKICLEVVGQDGAVLDGSYDGRHMNPGHAIEAGWFVFQYAKRTGDSSLMQRAVDMIEWAFEAGWDKEFGGLFYFLDSAGRSPPYLEWNMKLWWPHCEVRLQSRVIFC
jgi:N-acylglucosamine 2-epimerase